MNDIPGAEGAAEDLTVMTVSDDALTAFEWSLWRISAAFLRWQSECSSDLAGTSISGLETAVLHTIRYRQRPKGLSEICRLLGREDTANVQYAIKKLQSLRMIERVKGRSRKDTLYVPTPAGEQLTQDYRAVRENLLVSMIQRIEKSDTTLQATTEMLELLTSFYEAATRRVASAPLPAGASARS
ncbi:winged helix DNA-binding protein [Neorhizobium sp. NPDC001467]|uniref:winged helix DNA-binding protein n=1 Tax=Neorhizobium sp. NPDC001467 TaxID=3390595 RepID=UPI003CFDC468